MRPLGWLEQTRHFVALASNEPKGKTILNPMKYHNNSNLHCKIETKSSRPFELTCFFVGSYLIMLFLCHRYGFHVLSGDFRTLVFGMMVWLTYPLIYLFPAIIITFGLYYVLSGKMTDKGASWWMICVYILAIMTSTAADLIILTDQTIFFRYGFHLNGFVWNLITTPRGVESLGGSPGTIRTAVLIILAIFIFQSAVFWGIHRSISRGIGIWGCRVRKFVVWALILFGLATTSERIIYGFSSFTGYQPVIEASKQFPFYLPLTFATMGKKLGFKPGKKPSLKLSTPAGHENYPDRAVNMVQPEKPLNIVWLVAESWRWDMLSPEIMPNTWELAEARCSRFTNHYSGGIGTRMGMFSMFYGLPGPYWFGFLERRRPPVLMDVLQGQRYQLSMYTSARFTYPEFDKTIFYNVPKENLHEYHGGRGWQSDAKNVGDLTNFIRGREKTRPFFTFMFFESPHARYYFPEKEAIRKNYLKDFNYATMSDSDMPLIFNRYVNACHYLDGQIARIVQCLNEENLWENTIVILTGDHGEEFMENGHWGHNSSFTQQQLRVPLLVHIPDGKPAVVNKMTSHQDIVSTLVPLLGVTNPAESFSEGLDLFQNAAHDHLLAADWSRLCYITKDFKINIGYKTSSFFDEKISTLHDKPVVNSEIGNLLGVSGLHQIMAELTKFSHRG